MAQLTIYLEEKTQNKARRAAKRAGKSLSGWARERLGKAAEHYADIRGRLEKKGKVIGPADLIIAATARAAGAVLVTHNTKEFSRVPGLQIEDWTK